MSDAGQAQDLGHLRDVAEHVGEVAHGHHAAELGGAQHAGLEVAHDGLARDHELVHEALPRTDRYASARDESRDGVGLFGPYLEVVVDDDGLAVEQEPRVREVAVEHRQELVEQTNQADTEHLERLVPLAIPVRMGNDGHPTFRHPCEHTVVAKRASTLA